MSKPIVIDPDVSSDIRFCTPLKNDTCNLIQAELKTVHMIDAMMVAQKAFIKQNRSQIIKKKKQC